MSTTYYWDYPTKPIRRGNPYNCCAFCEVSDPEISGRIEKHRTYCLYRKIKEALINGYEVAMLELAAELDSMDEGDRHYYRTRGYLEELEKRLGLR